MEKARTPKEYQEALDELCNCAMEYQEDFDYEENECGNYEPLSENDLKRLRDPLQELIDESTPKKVLNKRESGAYVNVYVGECPKCGKFVTTIDKKPYQCECRQELDWGDE